MPKVIFLVTENEGQDVNIQLLNEHSGETSGQTEIGKKSLIVYKKTHTGKCFTLIPTITAP